MVFTGHQSRRCIVGTASGTINLVTRPNPHFQATKSSQFWVLYFVATSGTMLVKVFGPNSSWAVYYGAV